MTASVVVVVSLVVVVVVVAAERTDVAVTAVGAFQRLGFAVHCCYY